MRGTSVIEISKSALHANYDFMRELFGNVRISSVVKANAYGHGIEAFVPIAHSAGVDHFSVFTADEAMRIYKLNLPQTDIMIMGWMDDFSMEWAIVKGVEFFIFELELLEKALRIAKKVKQPAQIHIDVETGMNRTGLVRKDLIRAVQIIKDNARHFIVKGLCTHYAGAESIANHVRVQRQIKNYQKTKRWLSQTGIEPEIYHTACSAAAISYPNTRMDMVRIGILQYGFWPTPETFIRYVSKKKNKDDPLRRIIRWRSEIMSIKQVKTGEFISYGTTFLAQEDKTIAIVPVGYGHGYSRSLSNQGRVLIQGQRVGVVGMVNMNMLIADITYLPEAQVGDEVVLIGTQNDLNISVSSFSELSSMLNYELLARLPESIERVVVA